MQTTIHATPTVMTPRTYTATVRIELSLPPLQLTHTIPNNAEAYSLLCRAAEEMPALRALRGSSLLETLGARFYVNVDHLEQVSGPRAAKADVSDGRILGDHYGVFITAGHGIDFTAEEVLVLLDRVRAQGHVVDGYHEFGMNGRTGVTVYVTKQPAELTAEQVAALLAPFPESAS